MVKGRKKASLTRQANFKPLLVWGVGAPSACHACVSCWLMPSMEKSRDWEVFCYLGHKGSWRGSAYFYNYILYLYFIYNLPKVQKEEEVGFCVFLSQKQQKFWQIEQSEKERGDALWSFNQTSGHSPEASLPPVCQDSEIRRKRKQIWVFLRE